MSTTLTRWFGRGALPAFAAVPILAGCEAPDLQERAEEQAEEAEEEGLLGAPGLGVLLPDGVEAPGPQDEAEPFFDAFYPLEGPVHRVTFSSDGQQLIMAYEAPEGDQPMIYQMAGDEQGWDQPTPVPIDQDGGAESPAMSPDDAYLMWASTQEWEHENIGHYNVWMASGSPGAWGRPVPPPGLNTLTMDADPSLSGDGNLTFASERDGQGLDIFVANLEGGRFQDIENLGDEINSPADDRYPFFHPDEAFIVFSSDRDNPGGAQNLYITYNEGGEWTEAEPLDAVNTDASEHAPTLAPGGEYLFFNRGDEDVYWVHAEAAGIELPGDPVAEEEDDEQVGG